MKKAAILSLMIALVVAVGTCWALVSYFRSVDSAAGTWDIYRTDILYVMPLPEGNTRYILNEDGTGEEIFSGEQPRTEAFTWTQTGTSLKIVQEDEVLRGQLKGDVLIVKGMAGQRYFHRAGQEPPADAFDDFRNLLKDHYERNGLQQDESFDALMQRVDQLERQPAKAAGGNPPEPAPTATPRPTATPEPYAPAAVRRDVTLAEFDGTWKCFMMDDTRLGTRSFYQRFVLENGCGKRELGLAGQQPQRTDVLTGTLETIPLEGYLEPVPALVLTSDSFVPGYQVRLLLLEDGVLMEEAATMRCFYRRAD